MLKQPDEAVKELKQALSIDDGNAAVHFLLAQIYLQKNMLADAELSASRSVILDPQNEWYAKQLADIYRQQKEYEKAGDEYEKLYASHKQQLTHLYDATYMYVLAQKLDKALKILNDAEKAVGVNEEIIKQKQSIYLAQNKPDKAIKEIEKLISAYPGNTYYMGMLADVYLSARKEAKALEIYRNILKIEPDNGYALLALADEARFRKDNQQWFSYTLSAVKSPTLDVKPKLKVIVEFVSSNAFGDEQKARNFELAKSLTETNADEAAAWVLLGDLYAQSAKYKEAHDQYEKAVLIEPSNYTVWRQMILCSSELRDHEQVIKDCDRAIALFPNEPLYYVYYISATQILKQYDKSIEIARRGIEVSTDQKETLIPLYLTIGDAAHFLKRYATSDSAYEAALVLDPENTYALNNYAYFLSLRKQKLEKAEAMSKRSIELDEKNASYYDTYGWILFVQKKYAEAKTQIEKSLELEPRNAEVVDHYGDVLFFSGEVDKAVEQWKLAKSYEVENPVIDKKIKDRKWYEQ